MNKGGTKSAGMRLSVLQSFMFKIDKPDAIISTPPTIDSSVIKSSLITELEYFASI